MKHIFLLSLLAAGLCAHAETLTSPDGQLVVNVECLGGTPTYSVSYRGNTCLEASPLGLNTNIGDFTQNLTLSSSTAVEKVVSDYTLYNIKRSANHYEANTQTFTFNQKETIRDRKREPREVDQEVFRVTFNVSNNDVAFRYQILPSKREAMCCVINNEATGFTLPEGTTTFLCPQMGTMTGFARTAPSYETHYDADAEMGRNGWGSGYTFPCLFKAPYTDPAAGKSARRGAAPKNLWVLISETGLDGTYCASKIENKGGSHYLLSFPSEKENNGYGSATVQAALPSYTPWRTITVGETLKPIVETTVTWDVLSTDKAYQGLAEARQTSLQKYGRGSWSWIIANDESCNFDTQKEYIDFSAAMGWESLLIDAQWDRQIGRERIAELARYAKTKGVNLYLWYNSNGQWNDAPQTPRNCMDRSAARRAEMAWMQSIGIRGIKVDFFGGDKQCTIQLYEDILRDAQDFGILVIFHGCTLPRGWEMMYPNYAASEAVRASENLHFGQNECDREAMDATFLPFLRNTVGSMDFGGSTLNWYYNPKNSSEMWGGHRVTSDVFALATAVLFQSPVQHFAMAPGNLTDAPAWAVDFMKSVPTTWDDVRFLDGYPGKYVVLARRTGDHWYLTAVNGTSEPLRLNLDLSVFPAGSEATLYADDAKLQGSKKTIKISAKQQLPVVIPVNSGLLMHN